jgi:hypothetical protein
MNPLRQTTYQLRSTRPGDKENPVGEGHDVQDCTFFERPSSKFLLEDNEYSASSRLGLEAQKSTLLPVQPPFLGLLDNMRQEHGFRLLEGEVEELFDSLNLGFHNLLSCNL